MGSAALTARLYTGNVEAVEDKQVTTAPAAEIEIPETTENSTDEYEVTAWWKANLSDYNDNLSLVSYETVEAPEEETEPSDEGVVVNDTGVYVKGNRQQWKFSLPGLLFSSLAQEPGLYAWKAI